MPFYPASAAAPATAPAAPNFRYFIMGLTSMPAGNSFSVATSQQHLLTQFAIGMLSLEDVVDCLQAAALPAAR